MRPQELQDAGAACVTAALEVPVDGPAEAVRAVSVLPGGRAGPAASGLAARWEAATTLWCADLAAHGEALAAAATAYVTGDADAAAQLAVPGDGRP